MSVFRTGNHWGVTIVREGERARLFGDDAHGAGGRPRFPDNCGWPAEQCIGHASADRADDELVAVVVNGDRDLAERICALLNADSDRDPDMDAMIAMQEWDAHERNEQPVREGSGTTRLHPTCVDVSADDEPPGSAWICVRACRASADSCTCPPASGPATMPDPLCVVHRGRRMKGPKPPPLGAGCICDGSGRAGPRHGEVI